MSELNCALRQDIESDERFVNLRDSFKEYEVGFLKDSLQLYRVDKGLTEGDFIPTTPEEYAQFAAFVRERALKSGSKAESTNLTQEQVSELYSALYSAFTPKTLRARINSIANDFIDVVYKRMRKKGFDTPGEALKDLGGFQAVLDKLYKTLKKEDYDYIFNAMKESGNYADEEIAPRAEYIWNEHKKMMENWGRLTALASEEIGAALGVKVLFDGLELDTKNSYNLETETVSEDDNRDDGEKDKEKKEAQDLKGDRYIDYRTKKLEDTLSSRLRVILQSIVETNADGTFVTDDIGNKVRIGYRQASYALVELLEYTDPEDFMEDLQNAVSQYPWVQSIVDKLDKHKDWQTDFYVGLKKASHYYESIITQKQEYAFSRDNIRATSFNLMTDIGNKINEGTVLDDTYSIYDKNGLISDKKKLSSTRDKLIGMAENLGMVHLKAGKEATAKRKEELKGEFPYIELYGPDAMQSWMDSLDDPDVFFNTLVKMARGIGLQISASALKQMAMTEISASTEKKLDNIVGNSAYQNRLELFITQLAEVYEKAYNTRYRNNTSAFYNYVEEQLRAINILVSPSVVNELEHRALINRKTYGTWATGGFMKQWFGKFINAGGKKTSKWKDFIQKNFLDCEGFTINGNPIGWLRPIVQRINGEREVEDAPMKIVDMMEFNGVSYGELTRAQKATSSFMTWYLHGKTSPSHSYYECVIQADYDNAWNFIEAPKYAVGMALRDYVAKLDPDASEEQDKEETKKYKERFNSNYLPLYWKEKAADGTETEHFGFDVEGQGSSTRIVDLFAEEVEAEYLRILAIRQRQGVKHVVLEDYEKAGVFFNIFPEFNSNGFEAKYAALQKEGKTQEAKQFLRQEVAKQLEKIVERDKNVFLNDGLLDNPLFPEEFVETTDDGNRLTAEGNDAIREFSLNTYYARLQMVKMFLGDYSQFKNLANFEKRCMVLHAPRLPMYTEAYWDGKPVGVKDEAVLYVADEESKSAVYDELVAIAKQALKDKLISKDTYNNLIASYDKLKSTDGQGLRTMESARITAIENNKWSKKHEAAYNRLMNNESVQGDLDMVLDAFSDVYMDAKKPIGSGVEIIPAAEGDLQKNVRATFIHKYSEAVLLPSSILKTNFDAQSEQIKAFDRLNHMLHAAGQRKIDLFLFSSNVKVGLNSEVTPFKIEGGKRVFSDYESMAKEMFDRIQENPMTRHIIPFEFKGIAASTPSHLQNTRITWSSQAEKKAFVNVDIAPNEEINIHGSKLTLKQARNLHEKILAAAYIKAANELEEIKHNPKELERLLREELVSKPYVSDELSYALSLVRDASGAEHFIMPLFSPGVEHAVQQLFNSFIETRVARQMTKGANVIQVSSIGSDKESYPFENTSGFSEEDKLSIEFERDANGNATRIKWIDCYIGINDSRLERFTDPDGTIPPAKLRRLVKEGAIPEEILKFIAYRTPSDAEHSLLPLRIKGFFAKSGGPKIVVAKEAMAMTGHDYDGDKLRCHFIDFNANWDEERIESEYEKLGLGRLTGNESTEAKIILEQDPKALDSLDNFKRYIKSQKNPNRDEYYKIEPIRYDYDKDSPFDQGEDMEKKMNNARVELIFNTLTSRSGSMRLILPGGAGETVEHAKRFRVMRALNNPEYGIRQKLLELDEKKNGDNPFFTKDNPMSNRSIYAFLKKLSKKELNGLFEDIDSLITPYSFDHAVDAHEYMMGGARMIGIYAMYSSAADMFQRLGLRFNPYKMEGTDKNGKKYEYTIKPRLFNVVYDENSPLFAPKYKDNPLSNLIFARWINAAVDNGKEPVLGFLNQTPELSALTFMLVGMGLNEEQVHLIINQPVIVELNKRLARRGNLGLRKEAMALANELFEYSNTASKGKTLHPYTAISKFSKARYKEEDFANLIPISYNALKTNKVGSVTDMQMGLACLVWHLGAMADVLSDFAHVTRPEASANGVGPLNSDTLVQLHRWDKLRNFVFADDKDRWLPVIGMEQVLDERVFTEEMTDQQMLDEVYANASENQFARVVALHYLLQERTAEFMAKYFPQMKPEWSERMVSLAEEYNYRDIQPGTLEKIGQEMILFALLNDSRFGKNIDENYKHYVVDFPNEFLELKERVAQAQKDIEDLRVPKDKEAEELVGNLFITKLTVDKPYSDAENEEKIYNPRIRFRAGGPQIGHMAADIRNAWSQLATSQYAANRKLAQDLFMYNLYTSGFGYGMYEFIHFAPMNLIMDIEGYLPALRDVIDFDKYGDDDFWANFRAQHYMNHWGDTRLVRRYAVNMLSKELYQMLGYKGNNWNTSEDAIGIDDVPEFFTVYTSSGDLGFFRKGADNKAAPAEKLGIKTQSGQMSIQMNPKEDSTQIKAVQVGLDSVWGGADVLAGNRPNWMKFKNGSKGGFAKPGAAARAAVNSDVRRLQLNQLGYSSDLVDALMGQMEEAVMNNEEVLKSLKRELVAAREAYLSGVITSEEFQRAMQIARREPEQRETTNVSSQDDRSGSESVPVKVDETRASNEVAPEQQEEAPADSGFATMTPEEIAEMRRSMGMRSFFQLVRTDGDKVVSEDVPVNASSIREARKMKVAVELNKRLRSLLAEMGVSAGQLSEAEARLGIAGITDFDIPSVTAAGLIELIRLSNGHRGELALPEEFGHVSIALLGRGNKLVSRLFDALERSPEALEEAFEGMYDEYADAYKNDTDKLVFEAAGKLVAKHLFRQQQIENGGIRGLVMRVSDAIVNFFRKLNPFRIKSAMLEANDMASRLAKELLGGKIVDEMDAHKLVMNGKFMAKFKNDVTNKEDILNKMRKNAMDRLDMYEKRHAYRNSSDNDAAMAAMEKEIATIQQAIIDGKTEMAILSYIDNAVSFLADIEKELNAAENVDASEANVICEKLNSIRDTTIGYAQVLEDIEEAMSNGEVKLSTGLRELIDSTKSSVTRLHDKCDRIGMRYFEGMLSDFYGEDGITVEIGREKGRHITIREMARKGDHDISLAARFVSSLANCNDYVLKMVDDFVKRSKWNSRHDTMQGKQIVDSAYAKLVRETGSRDQTFMKEYYIGADGKKHSTGRFISRDSAQYKSLTKPQRDYYDTIMPLIEQADKFLPEGYVQPNHLIMLHRDLVDRVMNSSDVKSGSKTVWDAMRNMILDTSENFDPENMEVQLDFEGNKIDNIPILYTRKGKNDSYDNMTDDIATAVLAYISMANDYHYLNEIHGLIENAKYMSSKRDIEQRSGVFKTRKMRHTVTHSADDTGYYRPYTKKQKYTNIQSILNDYLDMQLYGHFQANEGTIGNTRVSSRKVVNLINTMATYSQMAANLMQRITNVTVGNTQIVIETAGKGAVNAKGVAWAIKEYGKQIADRIMETGKTDSDNYLSKFIEYFDIDQKNGEMYKNGKYGKSRLRKTVNTNLLFAGLTAGEDFLATITALSVARDYKMIDDKGNPCNLFEAYEVRYHDKANKTGAYLALKDGYRKADGSEMTKEDERNFANYCASLSFDLQGIYNRDDRNAASRYAFGSLFMLYRKWIAPAMKRRYGGTQYDALRKEYTEGYWRTLINFAQNVISSGEGMRTGIQINWEKLTDYERSNIHRAMAEFGILAGTIALLFFVENIMPKWDDDDDKPTWLEQQLLYQLLRLRNELGAQAPTPMLVQEAVKILKSPFAAVRPLQSALDVFQLLIPHNYFTKIRSGKYKGRSKAYKYFRDLPVISMFKGIDNFRDPSNSISYYQNGNFN